MLDVVKWAVIIVLIGLLIVALLTAFSGIGSLGSSAVASVRSAAVGRYPSPSYESPLVHWLAWCLFGRTTAQSPFSAVVPLLFKFVAGMGALYFAFLGLRFARAIGG